MYRYQVSRILEVFNGHSFEAVIDLGMGVYLKKNVILNRIHSPSPNSLDNNEKQYGIVAKQKLASYLRRNSVYLVVSEYDNETIHADVYYDEYEDSINDMMLIRGYVWEKKENNNEYKTWVLNYPK